MSGEESCFQILTAKAAPICITLSFLVGLCLFGVQKWTLLLPGGNVIK